MGKTKHIAKQDLYLWINYMVCIVLVLNIQSTELIVMKKYIIFNQMQFLRVNKNFDMRKVYYLQNFPYASASLLLICPYFYLKTIPLDKLEYRVNLLKGHATKKAFTTNILNFATYPINSILYVALRSLIFIFSLYHFIFMLSLSVKFLTHAFKRRTHR